jgi:hypothetical protein
MAPKYVHRDPRMRHAWLARAIEPWHLEGVPHGGPNRRSSYRPHRGTTGTVGDLTRNWTVGPATSRSLRVPYLSWDHAAAGSRSVHRVTAMLARRSRPMGERGMTCRNDAPSHHAYELSRRPMPRARAAGLPAGRRSNWLRVATPSRRIGRLRRRPGSVPHRPGWHRRCPPAMPWPHHWSIADVAGAWMMLVRCGLIRRSADPARCVLRTEYKEADT